MARNWRICTIKPEEIDEATKKRIVAAWQDGLTVKEVRARFDNISEDVLKKIGDEAGVRRKLGEAGRILP